MSPVVRHRLPTLRAHSHGWCAPHSQMLKTIGRPVARRASLMVSYEARASWVSVSHQSYFR
jgi:hypothetical protein